MTSAVDRRRDSHFPLFDSLRAIAALTVFAFHAIYQIAVSEPHERIWFRLGVNLDIGVPIFFAVSGFLLYRPFLAATLRGEAPSVRAYAWRRFLRIVPAYWVALAGLTIWFNFKEVQSLSGVLRYAGFAQVYDPDTALRGVGQAWTLDVEVVFYALLPVFALWLVRARTVRQALLGVGAVIGAGLAWNALALTQTDAATLKSNTWLLSFPAQMDQLGVGMLLAVLSVAAAQRGGRLPGLAGRLQGVVERRPAVPWTLAAIAWVLCAMVTRYGTRAGVPISDPQYMVKHGLRTACAFLVLMPAVFGGRSRVGAPRRLLAWRPLVYVGTISYSFYLWHYAVVAQFARWWGGPEGTAGWIGWVAGTLAGGLLIASASYFLVERPFMSLRRLVPAGPRAPQVEAAQARAAP